jgi:hypothetical protein
MGQCVICPAMRLCRCGGSPSTTWYTFISFDSDSRAEGMLFSLMALLSVWGGNSVDRAAAGQDAVWWVGDWALGEFLLPGVFNILPGSVCSS